MSAVEVIYTPGHTDHKGDTASTIGLAQEVPAERGCAVTRSEFLEAIEPGYFAGFRDDGAAAVPPITVSQPDHEVSYRFVNR